ncbi:MAG: AMP-dependent synthetase and ligase [Promethearchaeota archaeon CR_4]|nr:MAG: AMP-dependent synthetase and ligase [Candidatus Lokiarchaeota archaeon CR_4]
MEKKGDINSTYDYPNNLVDLFEQSVTKWPNNNLFGVKNPASGKYEWITFRQVADRANNLRGALKKLGLAKGEAAGVIVNNCVEWFICEQAVHGLGGVFVPMYETELKKIWQYIIADAEIKFLFVRNSSIYDQVKEFKKEIPTLKEIFLIYGEGNNSLKALEEMGKKTPVSSLKPAWSDLADIIYTSGTTGEPKGVMLSHGNLAITARSGAALFDINETMRVVAILPWAHVFGLNSDLHCYIHCGGSIALAESVDKLIQNFQEVQPTGLAIVPRIVSRVYDAIMQGIYADPAKKQIYEAAMAEAAKNRDLQEKTEAFKQYDAKLFSQYRNIFGGKLKYFTTGGALTEPKIASFFRDIGQPIYDGYGLTETSPSVAVNCPKMGNKFGTVGKPYPNQHVVIDKSLVGEDSLDGEICVYGPNVMMGYHKKPRQTADIMMPDKWNGFPGIRTGDRGWIDEDGFLHITGRFKDEYKLANGKYVHPEGIENDIKQLRYIANVMLYGEGKPYNVALVVPDIAILKVIPNTKVWVKDTLEESLKSNELKEYMTKEIIAHLSKIYGGYEVPKKFLFLADDFTLENGLITQTLKLKRANVMKKYGERLLALYNK